MEKLPAVIKSIPIMINTESSKNLRFRSNELIKYWKVDEKPKDEYEYCIKILGPKMPEYHYVNMYNICLATQFKAETIPIRTKGLVILETLKDILLINGFKNYSQDTTEFDDLMDEIFKFTKFLESGCSHYTNGKASLRMFNYRFIDYLQNLNNMLQNETIKNIIKNSHIKLYKYILRNYGHLKKYYDIEQDIKLMEKTLNLKMSDLEWGN